MAATRPYTYYDFTQSICNVCLRRTDAKIVFQDGNVYMLKHCVQHGHQRSLIATDIDYYKRCRDYIKPGEMPAHFATKTHYGCPYDCGLCTDHEQHSCLTLIEVTDRCNLTCPTCYAESSPTAGRHRTLEEIERMFDIIVASETEPDVVQLSGGEPTVHPDFFSILDMAKARPIRHLMVNTNGVRIAKDRAFTERLASYMPGFEVYLQFDSFRAEVLTKLRGGDLRHIRSQALEHLNEFNVSTTLVVTLERGLNDDEIGAIIEYALTQPCVRGVTFQPTQVAGRLDGFDPDKGRLTLTEVRQAIIDQSQLFTSEDLIPVPCNPDSLCMAYALKLDDCTYPLTRLFSPEDIIEGTRNTIVFEEEPVLRERAFKLFSTGNSIEAATNELQQLLCCLPQLDAPSLSYKNLFRVIIMQFLDPYIFDVRSVKRSCVHIVHPDGRIIPFDTMNVLYRNEHLKTLETIQRERIEGR
ncbi:radical SAM protein [soil metagenome]